MTPPSRRGPSCPEGLAEVPLAEGMLYLAERLAEGGAVAVSVDMNQLTWFAAGELSDVEVVDQRTALLLEHVRLWAETPPAPVGLDRRGRWPGMVPRSRAPHRDRER